MSVYDAGGRRVATQVGGVLTNVCVYDAMGKLIAEYGAPSAGPGGTSYLMSDHQGSPRVVTTANGAVISRHDYLPFGEELGTVGMRTSGQSYGAADAARQKYAGMESDDGSGMATTLWRKYDSSSGRWTSPDPYGGSMSVASPQSFNRYSYVNNDPVNSVDPTGLMLSDIGVYQTDDPEDAKIAEHQSLRDFQTSVNADSAAQHGGTVSYNGNHADFTSNAYAEAVQAGAFGVSVSAEITNVEGDPQEPTPPTAPIITSQTLPAGVTLTIKPLPDPVENERQTDRTWTQVRDLLAGTIDYGVGPPPLLGLTAQKYFRLGLDRLAGNFANEHSWSYTIGTYIPDVVAAPFAGQALLEEDGLRLGGKFAVDNAHHRFPLGLGKLSHLQATFWQKGVSESQWIVRIPLPLRTFPQRSHVFFKF